MREMSAIDVQDIMSRAYANVREFVDAGVQLVFIANGVSATIELSAYKKGEGLKTLSVCVFPGDKDKKLAFVDEVIDDLRHRTPYEVIKDSINRYKNLFVF